MNTLQKLRALAALEAAAAALRVDLKATAASTFEADGAAVSWATTDGTKAVTSVTHDRCEVADQDEFMTWLVERYPQLVHTVVEIRNPDVVKTLMAGWAKEGPGLGLDLECGCPATCPECKDDMGINAPGCKPCWDHAGDHGPRKRAVVRLSPGESWATAADVPGVVFVKGGTFGTLSVTIDRSLKRGLASAARAWVAGTRSSVFDVEAIMADVYGDEPGAEETTEKGERNGG